MLVSPRGRQTRPSRPAEDVNNPDTVMFGVLVRKSRAAAQVIDGGALPDDLGAVAVHDPTSRPSQPQPTDIGVLDTSGGLSQSQPFATKKAPPSSQMGQQQSAQMERQQPSRMEHLQSLHPNAGSGPTRNNVLLEFAFIAPAPTASDASKAVLGDDTPSAGPSGSGSGGAAESASSGTAGESSGVACGGRAADASASAGTSSGNAAGGRRARDRAAVMRSQGVSGASAAEPMVLSDSDDGDVTVPAKVARPAEACPSRTVGADTRPLCQYGSKCYRKNPQHRVDYRHDAVPQQPVQIRAPQTSRYFVAASALNEPGDMVMGAAGLVDLISDEDD